MKIIVFIRKCIGFAFVIVGISFLLLAFIFLGGKHETFGEWCRNEFGRY
jgi:hypothetical protein